jgi:mannitol/fructose-specific phosphotransferase system IIA component (Ntr-type)
VAIRIIQELIGLWVRIFRIFASFFVYVEIWRPAKMMRLSERIEENGIIINSQAKTKNELMKELVDLAINIYGLSHGDEILEAVYKREQHKSTGVGSGVAVPHAKVDYVDKMYMVAASVKEGMEFEAQDGRPVYLAILLLSPSNTIGPHVQALSAIARIMANAEIRRQLIECETPAAFVAQLKEAEENASTFI